MVDIRLTVRPQHQVGRFFLKFPIGLNNIGTAHTIATSMDSKETKRGIYLDITFYLCEPMEFERKYCTIPLKCVQIDNPVKIFGFVKQLC